MRVCRTILLSVVSFLMTVPAWAEIDTVRVQDFSFTPSTLTVQTGDTVVWKVIGRCCEFHTVTSDGPEPWDSGELDVGQTFQRGFNQAGTYPYYCINHNGVPPYGPYMKGTIVVETPPPIPALGLAGGFLLLVSLTVTGIWILRLKRKAV